MEHQLTIQKRDEAKQYLAEIKSVETGVEYLNKVKAIEVWAKAEKKDAELVGIATEIKIRTQRRLGELLKEDENIKRGNLPGANNRDVVKSKDVTLQNLCITKNDSSTFQRIASLPEEKFEQAIIKIQKSNLSTNAVLQVVKDEERATFRQEAAEAGKSKPLIIDFRLGDFEQVLSDIPDGSLDCIITDPPYPHEYIECWSNLSRFAQKKLKPNGFCIAYSGQKNLPEVINRMNAYLSYYWTFCIYLPGSTQIINATNFMCLWKPVLIFQNGFKKRDFVSKDYFISERREKHGHEWQQSISGVSYLIETFSKPGDLICEPFAGAGTTIKAAMKLNRQIIAAEINEDTYNIAKANL